MHAIYTYVRLNQSIPINVSMTSALGCVVGRVFSWYGLELPIPSLVPHLLQSPRLRFQPRNHVSGWKSTQTPWHPDFQVCNISMVTIPTTTPGEDLSLAQHVVTQSSVVQDPSVWQCDRHRSCRPWPWVMSPMELNKSTSLYNCFCEIYDFGSQTIQTCESYCSSDIGKR